MAQTPDPLIAAAIGKLPPPGESWPAEQRRAWLKLIELALDVVYGGPLGGGMSDTVLPKIPLRGAAAAEPAAEKPKPADPPFYVDLEGYARNEQGDRILPGDIAGPLYDKRGEHGDLSKIRWADDTLGVKGLHLDISSSA